MSAPYGHKPSWEQGFDADRLETEEILRQQGEAESRRMADNLWMHGDVLATDDGRPGIGINRMGVFFGDIFTFGMPGQFILWGLGAAALVLIFVVGQWLKSREAAQPPAMPTAPPPVVAPAAPGR